MYTRTTSIDPAPGGDTVKAAVLDLDTDLTGAFTHLNSLDTDKAPLADPDFTGTPTAPTATAGTDTTQIATTAFVKALGDTKAALAGSASQAFSTAALTTSNTVTADVPYSNTVTARHGIKLRTGGSTNWWNFGIASNGEMVIDQLQTVNLERMRFTNTGNVLIGDSVAVSGAKLEVTGAISATLQVFADNTAAAALATGTMYRTATGQVMIKY